MGQTPLWSHEILFPADAVSMAEVRHFVGAHLAEHDDASLVPDLQLVASELATNALVHGETPFTVLLEQVGRSIRLTVRDGCRSVPVPRGPTDGLEPGGCGLLIVETLSSEWGVTLDPNGSKSVWAAFDHEPHRSAGGSLGAEGLSPRPRRIPRSAQEVRPAWVRGPKVTCHEGAVDP